MFSIEKLSRNCSSFEELIASKLNLNYIHNIAKAITPCCAASTRSPYLIIWWRQTDVMMPRWIVYEKRLCCFNNNTPKLSLKSRATLPALPRLPPLPVVTQSYLHLPRVFRYSIDRSSFLPPLMLPLWKLFKDNKKPTPFSPGQKYIRRGFPRFPTPFSYTNTHPSSDNIFEKVFFSLSFAAFLVFRSLSSITKGWARASKQRKGGEISKWPTAKNNGASSKRV